MSRMVSFGAVCIPSSEDERLGGSQKDLRTDTGFLYHLPGLGRPPIRESPLEFDLGDLLEGAGFNMKRKSAIVHGNQAEIRSGKHECFNLRQRIPWYHLSSGFGLPAPYEKARDYQCGADAAIRSFHAKSVLLLPETGQRTADLFQNSYELFRLTDEPPGLVRWNKDNDLRAKRQLGSTLLQGIKDTHFLWIRVLKTMRNQGHSFFTSSET